MNFNNIKKNFFLSKKYLNIVILTMPNMENYEICFDCRRLFFKHELYRDWDSYCAGLFPVDKNNERMYNLSLFIQRETLWRCPALSSFY